MKEQILNAHNAAMTESELSLDVDYLLGLLNDYIGNKKSFEDISKELKNHYKEDAEKYIEVFEKTFVNGYVEEKLNSLLEQHQQLNNDQFKQTILNQEDKIKEIIHQYIKGDLKREDLLNKIINESMIPVGESLLRSYNINREDIEAITFALQGSADIVAYAAFNEVYLICMDLLNDASVAHQRRLEIEEECAKAVDEILEYRQSIVTLVSDYLEEGIEVFEDSFEQMELAILHNDSNGYIKANVKLQEQLGHKIQFTTQKEFDDLMSSDVNFVL